MSDERRFSVAELLAKGGRSQTDAPAPRRHRAREGARSVRELTGSFRAITDEDLAREEAATTTGPARRRGDTGRFTPVPVPEAPTPAPESADEVEESGPSAVSGLRAVEERAEESVEPLPVDAAADATDAGVFEPEAEVVDSPVEEPLHAVTDEDAVEPIEDAEVVEDVAADTAVESGEADVVVDAEVDAVEDVQPAEADRADADDAADHEESEATDLEHADAAVEAESVPARGHAWGDTHAADEIAADPVDSDAQPEAYSAATWDAPEHEFSTGGFGTATLGTADHTGALEGITEEDIRAADALLAEEESTEYSDPVDALADRAVEAPADNNTGESTAFFAPSTSAVDTEDSVDTADAVDTIDTADTVDTVAEADDDEVDFTVDESAYADDVAAPTPWWMLLLLVIGGLAVGGALFYGFSILWAALPWVAVILAVLVIAGLLVLASVLSPGGKVSKLTLVIFAIAGIAVTFGPLLRSQL